jgi:hypothetical protein
LTGIDMPEPIEITYHDTQEDVRAAWRSLCLDGGYTLYVNAAGNLHALRIGAGGIPGGN